MLYFIVVWTLNSCFSFMVCSLSDRITVCPKEDTSACTTLDDTDKAVCKEIVDVEMAREESGTTRIWTKWLFFLGFLCPILWVIGSKLVLKDSDLEHGFIWKKRCRIAVTIMLTLGIVASVLVMIFNPQAFGLRRNTSAGPQTSSNSNSALRPDVPVNGTSTTGNIIAGIIVASQ